MGEDENPAFTKLIYLTGISDFFKSSNRHPGWMDEMESAEWFRGWKYGKSQVA